MGGWRCVLWKSTCCTCREFHITGWEAGVVLYGRVLAALAANSTLQVERLSVLSNSANKPTQLALVRVEFARLFDRVGC